MKTCVVVPTYNEHENISAFVGAIYGAMKGDVTVCVVDDNSPDGTAQDVEDLKKLFPSLILINRPGKAGLGTAYIHGFTEMLARNEFDALVITDADFSEHPLYIPSLIEGLKENDVVMGSRYTKGADVLGSTFIRRLISHGANAYVRAITGMSIHDMTVGFGAIRTETLKKIDLSKLSAPGYAFIVELKYALHKTGAQMKEIPITFVNRIGGQSKFSSHLLVEGLITPWRIRFPERFNHRS
jgi:dolichol-phosphate mannosyltransferase